MTFNRETILGITFAGIGVVLFFFVIPWQVESPGGEGVISSAFFPKVGAILLIMLGLMFTAVSIKGYGKPRSKSPDPMGKKVNQNVFFSTLSIALYVYAIALVGFLVATPPFLILLMIILGARVSDWLSILIVACTTPVAIYGIFIKILGLSLP